ncbi:MAG TPA: DNA repair protein RecO [Bacteroidales bacterium]|nr:DNA repair protein RecO [Bacteroidales bacterium]
MIYKTRGIVLHHIKYSETSVIATIYTEQFGRQAFMINGVRGKKSKIKANILQPLYLLNMEAYHKTTRDLQRVKEIQNACIFNSLPYDLKKSTLALFIAEILNQTLREQEPHPELFNYLYHSIQMLDVKEEGLANFHIYFLLHLTKYLGFFPNNNFSESNPYFDLIKGIFTPFKPLHSDTLSKEESEILSRLLVFSDNQHEKLKMNYLLRVGILGKILKYYKLHHEGVSDIRSFQILKEVFH